MSGEEFTGDKNKKTISAFGGRLQVERPDFYFAPSKTYGILGWIETIIKGLAGIIAIVTITGITIGAPISRYVNGLRMGQVILIGILMLYYLVLPVHRYLEGEVFALIFSLYQVVTHLFLLFGSIFRINVGDWIFAYAFLMLLGELVKIIFLVFKKEFTQRYLPRLVLFIISITLSVAYGVLFSLQIAIWLREYPPDTGV